MALTRGPVADAPTIAFATDRTQIEGQSREISQALGQFGAGLGDLAQKEERRQQIELEKRNRLRDAAYVSEVTSRMTEDLNSELLNGDQNWQAGSDIAAAVHKKAEDLSQDFLKTAPSEEARILAQDRFNELRARFTNSAANVQATRQAQFHVERITQARDKLSNTVFTNPALFDVALSEAIDNNNLALQDQGSREKANAQAASQIAVAHVSGRLSQAENTRSIPQAEGVLADLHAGKFDSYLQANERAQLESQAQASIRALKAGTALGDKIAKAQANSTIGLITDAFESGRTVNVSADNLQQLAALSEPSAVAALDLALQNYPALREARSKDAFELSADIAKLEGQAKSSVADEYLLPRYKRILSERGRGSPFEAVVASGYSPAPPLPTSQDGRPEFTPDAVAQREAWAQSAEQFLGRTAINPLDPQTTAQMVLDFNSESPEAFLSRYAGVTQFQPARLGALLREVAPKAPLLAVALDLTNDGAIDVASDVMRGAKVKLAAAQSKFEVGGEFEQAYQGLRMPDGTPVSQMFRAAAIAAYAAQANQDDLADTEIDPDKWDAAQKRVFGSPVVFNGLAVAPPVRDMPQGQFADMIYNLKDTDLKEFGGYLNERGGVDQAKTAPLVNQGEPVNVSDITGEGHFVSIGAGWYQIYLGEDPRNRLRDGIGGQVFVLNLEKLSGLNRKDLKPPPSLDFQLPIGLQ